METTYAKQKIIKDIKNDDEQIQITGYVRNIADNYFILDDRTGKIKVITTESGFINKKNDLINVIGVLSVAVDGEKMLQAKIIQDMTNLNFKYYLKLYELKRNLP